MELKILRTLGIIVIISFWSASYSFGQNKLMNQTHNDKMEKYSSKNMKMNMKEMKDTSKTNSEEPRLYKGIINLKEIDKNKDGKIYQCPMDFNVLSDKPGIDPKCGMKLKKVTIKEAGENLLNHGFHVKK